MVVILYYFELVNYLGIFFTFRMIDFRLKDIDFYDLTVSGRIKLLNNFFDE